MFYRAQSYWVKAGPVLPSERPRSIQGFLSTSYKQIIICDLIIPLYHLPILIILNPASNQTEVAEQSEGMRPTLQHRGSTLCFLVSKVACDLQIYYALNRKGCMRQFVCYVRALPRLLLQRNAGVTSVALTQTKQTWIPLHFYLSCLYIHFVLSSEKPVHREMAIF